MAAALCDAVHLRRLSIKVCYVVLPFQKPLNSLENSELVPS